MGHTVLAVPVPALETVVRRSTAGYDPSFVSTDPGFAHAHITVLAPWAPEPQVDDLARVAEIAGETPAFMVILERIEEFPDGLLHLRPEPEDGLRGLTRRLAEAFPAYPPYGGAFDDVVPHLTLDQRSETVTPEAVHARVAHLLPVAAEVDRVDLQWWASGDCRLLRTFRLKSDTMQELA